MGHPRLGVAAAAVGLLAALLPGTVLAGSGNISGTLFDDDTSGFAAGVTVNACGSPGCPNIGSVSNSSGQYQLNGIPSGNGWNVITNPGSCPSTSYATAHRYGVNVSDNTTTTGVNMHLTKQKGAISGKVLNSSGQGVGGVNLVVDNSQTGGYGFGSTTSASDGSYTVNCLAAAGVAGSGSYFITAFPPSPYNQQQDSGITVSPNTTTNHNIILGSGGGSIVGTVTCGGGSCGVQINVLVFCENCSSSSNIMTNTFGNYASTNVAGGHKYDVHAIGPSGWDNAIVYGASVTNGSSTTVNLNLTASGPGTSGRLVGTISDPAGALYPGCQINAFGSNSFASANTTGGGTYDTGYVLAPGNYTVFIDCPNWPEQKANGGAAVGVSAGSTVTANFVYPEYGRPFTGGHDVVGIPSGSTQAYFAEGYTGFLPTWSFHEQLAVFNPGAAQTLTVTYLLASGGPIVKNYNLAAQSRFTINVNADVGPTQEVSAWLTAPHPFVAEREMYFRFPTGVDGGSNAIGAQSLGTTFYFAEGYTGGGFDEYLTLMNTSATQTANVQVTYFFNGGAAPKTVGHPVAPSSRLTVHVNDSAEAGPNQEVSMKVTSDIPILAERPMYFNYYGQTGGDVIMGASAPITSLNLAEGHVGQSFNEYLTILNPNASAANLTITYFLGSGSPVQQLLQVKANSRATVYVNSILPAGTDDSVHITSDQPIVVERPMYFTYNGWTGGHDAMAGPDSALGTTMNFAEGYVASNFAQYVTILNKWSTATTVTFTFYETSGAPVTKTITIPANSRWTELVNNDLPAGTYNSLQLTASQPILAERPEYFSY
jgi:hypothetical protein